MFKSLDELYKDLIRHGADPTAHEDKTESESIIHCAAAAGKLKFCETLLDLHDPHTRSKRVVDVNTVDAKERTPLINAAEAGDISVLCTCLWLNTMPTSGWEMGLAMMRSWRLVVGVMSVLPHFSWGGGSFVMGSCVIATWTRRISKRFLCYIFAVALGHVEVVEFLFELGASAENIKLEDVGAMMGSEESCMSGQTPAILELLGMGPLGPGSTVSPPK